MTLCLSVCVCLSQVAVFRLITDTSEHNPFLYFLVFFLFFT